MCVRFAVASSYLNRYTQKHTIKYTVVEFGDL